MSTYTNCILFGRISIKLFIHMAMTHAVSVILCDAQIRKMLCFPIEWTSNMVSPLAEENITSTQTDGNAINYMIFLNLFNKNLYFL